MTPREKKLMLAVIGVSIFAAADFLYTSLTDTEGAASGRSELQEAKTVIASVGTQLVSPSIKMDESRVLELANAPYEKDVLATPKADATVFQAGDQLPFLSCSGFIMTGKKYIAIINSQEYVVGDTIVETGEHIIKIDETGVVVELPSTGARRRLLYSDNDVALEGLSLDNTPSRR